VSIPKKNIKLLAGRPLIDWVIKPALDSGIFAEVWVSTDDDEIAAVTEQCGAKVHRRAPETATNTASTESALIDFVDAHPDYDILCLIQATSPLVMPEDFQKGLQTMEKAGADSLVTAVRTHRFLWSVDSATGLATAKNYDPVNRPRRQDWNGELIENGAFYFTTKAIMDSEKCRLGGKLALYEMEEHTLTELDSLIDWQIVSHMVDTYGYWPGGKPEGYSPSLPRMVPARATSPISQPLAG
jgi:CMP-N-acetylneuraminic acid synthetase